MSTRLQVDAVLSSSKLQGSRDLHRIFSLLPPSSSSGRQTVLASATVPQATRFLADAVKDKWVKVGQRGSRWVRDTTGSIKVGSQYEHMRASNGCAYV